MTDKYSPEDVVIRHDPENRKYEALHGNDGIGVVVYEQVGGHITISHAAIQESYRRQGVGTKLIGTALDDVQTLGKPIKVRCPVVRDFIKRNPQYAHLLDQS